MWCQWSSSNVLRPVSGNFCATLYTDKQVRESTPLYRQWGSVQAVRLIGGVEVLLYPFMTTVLEGGEGSESRPGRSLPPGKTRYPLYRRLGGPQGRSGQVRKISPPPGFDLRTVQPVASHYTDWATGPNVYRYITLNFRIFFFNNGVHFVFITESL